MVLNYWSYFYFSVVVEDLCCLLPQRFHLLTLRKPQPSSRDSIYSVSGLCFNIFYEFLAFIPVLDLAVRTLRLNKKKKEKTYLSRNECVVGSFRVFTFPCAQNDYKYGGTNWLDNCEIRCCSTSDVNNRLSSPAQQHKTDKRSSNIKHFQMLKLMFYLTITKLMLSLLLLLLLVFLLHNENPSFPLCEVLDMFVKSQYLMQVDRLITLFTVC